MTNWQIALTALMIVAAGVIILIILYLVLLVLFAILDKALGLTTVQTTDEDTCPYCHNGYIGEFLDFPAGTCPYCHGTGKASEEE